MCKQTMLLFRRNMTVAFRNPLQLMAVVILGVMQSIFMVCLYGGIGKVDLTP